RLEGPVESLDDGDDRQQRADPHPDPDGGQDGAHAVGEQGAQRDARAFEEIDAERLPKTAGSGSGHGPRTGSEDGSQPGGEGDAGPWPPTTPGPEENCVC